MSSQELTVEKFVSILVSAFSQCGYLWRPLRLDLDGYITIEIRMPPSLPEAAIRKLGHSGAAQAFPAIAGY